MIFAGNQPPSPQIISRPARGDGDFWRVRDLLVETCPLTPPAFNWDVRHWDSMRFYNADPGLDPHFGEKVQMWETQAGRLVGVVHTGGGPYVALQLHPGYRHIEAHMIAWAEVHFAAPAETGQGRQLNIYVYEYDAPRRFILQQRGYTRISEAEVIRRMHFVGQPIPTPEIAAGYTLRTTNPEDDGDCQRVADLLNAAFGRDFHNPEEYRNFTQHAPSFHPDLDLVAQAPDGCFAAYVGVPYDQVNRRGIFEPVCTHPDHRRKGLARALMIEALHRLQAIGAADVTVETGTMLPANRLYDTIGFTEVYKGSLWRKLF